MSEIFKKNLRQISKFEFTPKGWREICVRDVCDLGRGRVISHEEIKSNPGLYPVYSSQTSNDGLMGSLDSYEFNSELITWTTDGANAGTVFFRQGKFNCTNVCGTLTAKSADDLDLRFLTYQIGRIAKQYVSYHGNPKLMNDVMGRVALIIPSQKAEQHRISEILLAVDDMISNTEALIHKYQQIKAGLMHDLFTRGLAADGKLRPPREQAPELYQETPIGCIPKEWEVKKVGDLCLSIVPGRDKPILDRGDLPWITVSDIELLYVFESIEGLSLSRSSLKKAHGRIIPKGAVVMSCVGSFGLVALTGKELVINQQLHAFVVGDQIIPEWLVFNLERQKRYMEKIATQTTILYLNKDACESVPIVVPSKKEQQHLVEKIKSISDQIFVEQQVALKLNKQKSGLMHDLLTGKVPVTIDQEETAHGS